MYIFGGPQYKEIENHINKFMKVISYHCIKTGNVSWHVAQTKYKSMTEHSYELTFTASSIDKLLNNMNEFVNEIMMNIFLEPK